MPITSNVEFSEKEVIDIVRRHLENEGFEIVGAIKINVDNAWRGYGQGERQEAVFENITATVQLKARTPREGS